MAKDWKEVAKNFNKQKIKLMVMKAMMALATVFIKFLPLIIVAIFIGSILFNWQKEINQGKSTAHAIYEVLETENLSELIEIKGNDTDGYYWGFKDDTDSKLDSIIKELEDNHSTVSISDKELLKKMILAQVVTQYPDLGGTISSEDGFQGAIHLRRVTPDKEIGKLEDVSTGVTVEKGTYVEASSVGLGTKEDISDAMKSKMEGISMNGLSGTSYEDLSYLTIPYYSFSGDIEKGHMVVNKELADEVLLIFQELYNIKYPIQKMEPVEEFNSKMGNVDFGEDYDKSNAIKLNITSMWHNNTSSFNDRTTNSGEVSNHALGCAIDINPLINPYVKGTYYSPSNAEKYTDRTMSEWTDIEKQAVINEDSEIYKIFTKYGWTWGGSWESSKDYNHFEKTDLTDVTHITSIIVETADEEDEGSSTQTTTFTGNSTNNAGINSKIYDLKYVSKELFERHLSEGKIETLKEFTIDVEDSNKIVVATWDVKDGVKTVKEKILQAGEIYTQKYTMPIEYLLSYYIDTRNEEFVTDLANLAIDSEFVLAIQDNVTTRITKVFESVTVKNERCQVENNTRVPPWELISTDTESDKEISSTLVEVVSTSIELTYGDTWFVKFYKEINYSSEDIQPESNTNRIDTEQTINGNVNITNPTYKDAPVTDVQTTWNVSHEGTNNGKGYSDRITTTTTTTTKVNSISYKYNTGTIHVLGNEQKFITIYKKNEEFKTSLKPEWLFTVLEKQSKTVNMVDLTKYLIYLARGQRDDYGVTQFDFSIYIDNQFTNANSQGQIPLHEPVLSKEDFVKAMQEYSIDGVSSDRKDAFDNNFLPYAAEIYDWACAANVNPELVVVTALWEGGFKPAGGNYNYWGLSVENGESSGDSFSSFKEGIEGYASYIAKYENPDSWFYKEILNRKAERLEAGVDPLGYGDPDTLSGQQSLYSDLGSHGSSSSGSGGYYYMDPDIAGVTKIYATHEEFLEKCKNSGLSEHAVGTQCTVYEKGQYTAWQVENKIKSWNDIFGNYGSLSSSETGNQEIVEIAKSKLGCPYGWGNHGPDSFDCSGLVEWVYRQVGIEVPWSTAAYSSDIGSTYEISWEDAQPGDILIILKEERTDGVTCGHAAIYLGNDEYIHAPQEGDVVKISSGAKNMFTHVFRYY